MTPVVVVDASVALKWFFRSRGDEPDVDRALALLKDIDAARLRMVEPIHFIAEVAAVLAREKPRQARDDVLDLLDIERDTVDTPGVYVSALDLAIRCGCHAFDTLYHAVALQSEGATLVTADRRYYEKTRTAGQITLLAHWERA